MFADIENKKQYRLLVMIGTSTRPKNGTVLNQSNTYKYPSLKHYEFESSAPFF